MKVDDTLGHVANMRIPLCSLTVAILLVMGACTKPNVRARPVALSPSTLVAVYAKANDRLANQVENAILGDAAGVRLVARRDQKEVGEERALQQSGSVSDESMVSLGQALGASLIIVAEETLSEESFFSQKSRYGLRLTAIDVESGAVLGFAEVKGAKEAFSAFGECDFECLKGMATEEAVSQLLGSKSGG